MELVMQVDGCENFPIEHVPCLHNETEFVGQES